ncbi:MAG TPA: nucleoside phosphorylase [Actinomycetota bacterium]|nr:nucleoside phosphorylase [Actinomycetota bacterium]
MTLQYHVKLDEGDVAPSVLLPGDPGRVPVIASFWDEAREVARNREYVTYTGTYEGVPISCTSTGIGAPSTAIALEELARVGATTFLRVGTTGSLQPNVRIGDVAIFDSAERQDGASRLYAPIEYPAAAHHDVVVAAIQASTGLGIASHVGTTYSTDLFYTPHEGFAFGGYHQSWARESFEDARRRGTLAAEMEASVLLVLTRIWGLRGGAIAVVADDVFASTNEAGEIDAEATFDVGASNMERLARVGSETVRILAERDAAR